MKRKTKRSDALRPDPRNARKHGEHNVKRIDQSLAEVGAGRGILADGENIIRAGSGIYERAKRAGFKFKIVDVDPKTILVSRRKDLKGKKAIRAAMLDNLASDSSAFDYDAEVLAGIAKDDELIAAIVKEEKQLVAMLGVNGGSANAEPQVDRAAELQKKWQVKTGDLWRIADHRLLCGDSTKREDVERVMQGDIANFSFTDPPYNVGIKYQKETDDRQTHDNFVLWCKSWSQFLPKQFCMTVGVKRLLWWRDILGGRRSRRSASRPPAAACDSLRRRRGRARRATKSRSPWRGRTPRFPSRSASDSSLSPCRAPLCGGRRADGSRCSLPRRPGMPAWRGRRDRER